MFVVDTFSSLSLVKDFLIRITTEVIHNSPKNSVGLISYNLHASIEFNLKAYMSLSELLSAINQLNYGYGGTNTAEALQLLLSSAQNGALGLRNNSSKIAIVITDGRSDNQAATISAAAALHASNIFDVYAVGVGRADVTELEGIASSLEFVFFTSSFDEDNVHQLQNRILPQLYNGKYITV